MLKQMRQRSVLETRRGAATRAPTRRYACGGHFVREDFQGDHLGVEGLDEGGLVRDGSVDDVIQWEG